MESLALLVSAIIMVMLLSGVLALLLTFRKSRAISNVTAKPLQRVVTLILATISLLIGLQILTQVDSIGGRVLGAVGVTTAAVAIYRVFKK
jgi:succinate dehydrogenase hydrophobic anchor subunit